MMRDLAILTDPLSLRRALGHYPTGVCLITAVGEDGQPVGLIVGSFTSASLDPPLVAFFPDRRSSSWRQIAAAGRFCVNILAGNQEALCRRLAGPPAERFADASYRLSDSGLPVLNGVVAWIECDLHAVFEAGDHFIALGRIHRLDVERPEQPLLFFRGNYGQFAPSGAGALG